VLLILLRSKNFSIGISKINHWGEGRLLPLPVFKENKAMIINREVLNSNYNKKESYTDRDLFEYTLEVASEMNDDISMFMEGIVDFNRSTSGKKIFDFGAIINAIFNALWEAIKKIFKQFLALLAHLASMGSSFEIELRRFKDKIQAMDKEQVKLDFPFYRFTNLDKDNCPNLRKVEEIVNSLVERYDNGFAQAMKQVKAVGNKDLSGYVSYKFPDLEELNSRLIVDNERNIMRNYLLGGKGTDDCGDFAKRLFVLFRGSETPINGITLTGREIYNNYYLPYVNYNADVKYVKSQQAEVEKTIKNIKRKVENKFSTDPNTGEASMNEQINQVRIQIQRKICTVLDLMSQDILMMYGQKLQAYKDNKLQCRQVLVAAIKACITQQ